MTAFDRIREADVGRLLTYSLAVVEDAPTDTDLEVLPLAARWAGCIGMEDELTGDAREIAGGALTWEITPEALPPLRYVQTDVGFHDGAEDAGSIDSIQRREGGVIWGEGPLHMDTPAGQAAYRAIQSGTNGVSMDLDDVSFEIRVAAELYEEMQAFWDALEGDGEAAEPEEPEKDSEGRVIVAKVKSDDEVQVTTGARIRAATIVSIPAFNSARISIVDVAEEEQEEVAALVAAARPRAPLAPPEDWFRQIELTEPTALTVTREGRVYGHLALWGTCHVSHSAGGKCVTPPNSPSDYAWFHTGALETKEGSVLAVGHLTMNTGHAPDDLGPAATLAHYDNTGTVAADVRAYEDQFGILVVGGLRSTLSGEQVRAFRAAPLSGDWRYVGAALELVAALSVNVPGFGVPRPSGFVHDGNLVSLTASGIIFPVTEETAQTLSHDDLTYLRSFIARERRHELDALASIRNRAQVDRFARNRRRNRKG